jgi:hypothetical protein
VTVLPPGPRRQQPQLSHTPHRRETITGLLAAEFGISDVSAHAAVNRKTWAHVS